MRGRSKAAGAVDAKDQVNYIKPPPDPQPLWKGYLSLAVRMAIFVVILILIFTKVLFLKRVGGSDMFPSLKDGDLTLGYRLQTQYRLVMLSCTGQAGNCILAGFSQWEGTPSISAGTGLSR